MRKPPPVSDSGAGPLPSFRDSAQDDSAAEPVLKQPAPAETSAPAKPVRKKKDSDGEELSAEQRAELADLELEESAPFFTKRRLVAAGSLVAAGAAAAVTAVVMLGGDSVEDSVPQAGNRAPVPGEVFENPMEPATVEHPEIEDWVAFGNAEVPMVDIGSYGGHMEIPESSLAGLYEELASPGDEQGTALVAAHVDEVDGSPAAFWNLHQQQIGDTVTTFVDGEEYEYEIVGLDLYEQDELPQDLFDASGDHRLMLMTCAGEPVENDGPWRYRYNLIAEAVPISS